MSYIIDNIIKSQCVEDYLDFFENKDLTSIENLLADNCSLSDWEIGTVNGKDDVMKVFSNIFDTVKNISVSIQHIHEDPDVIICEMILTVDEQELLVADIFEFDKFGRIKCIRAYKG